MELQRRAEKVQILQILQIFQHRRRQTALELAAATGFPNGYRFVGGDTAAKKMIGNAVCPPLAEALYRSALSA